MTNRAAAFSEVDLKRAIRGAEKAGFPPRRVEITRDGTICLVLAGEPEPRIVVDDEGPVIL